jgi:hypothetical protein
MMLPWLEHAVRPFFHSVEHFSVYIFSGTVAALCCACERLRNTNLNEDPINSEEVLSAWEEFGLFRNAAG